MTRGRVGAVAAGLVVAAVALALVPRGYVGVAHDDGTYLAVAKSLAEGHGFRLAFLPGASVAHVAPLYPALLALLWGIWPAFPANLALLRLVNPLLLGLFAGGFAGYLTWRRVLPAAYAAVAAAVLATALPLLAQATVLLADSLALVLALGAWVLADASAQTQAGRRATVLAAGAGVAAGLCTLSLAIGAGTVVAVVAVLAAQRRMWEASLAAACAALVVVPWEVWSASQQDLDPLLAAAYGGYGALVRQAGAGALSLGALGEVLRPLGRVAFATLKESYHPYAGAPALVVLIAGGVALGGRAPALGWSLAGCLAVILAWPYGADRFVWVLVPALGVALISGALALWRGVTEGAAWRRLAVRGLVLAGVLPTAAGFVPLQVEGLRSGAAMSAQRSASAVYDRMVPWLRSETPDSAVIAGENEALVWLYTGRRAVPSNLWHLVGRAPVSYGADSLRAYLNRTGATHLLVTNPRSEATEVVDDAAAAFFGYLRAVKAWPGPVTAFVIDRTARPPTPSSLPSDTTSAAPQGRDVHPPVAR